MQLLRRVADDAPFDYAPLQFLWHNVIKPNTRAAIKVTSQAIQAAFIVQEAHPRCEVTENFGRICTDSACELFLAFPDAAACRAESFVPQASDQLYLNFEVNTAGFIYAKYGRERQGRVALSDKQLALLEISAQVQEQMWTLELSIPRTLLQEIADFDVLADGCNFAYNLYKISEHPSCEHYAARFALNSPTPNFHRPQDFQAVKIVP